MKKNIHFYFFTNKTEYYEFEVFQYNGRLSSMG